MSEPVRLWVVVRRERDVEFDLDEVTTAAAKAMHRLIARADQQETVAAWRVADHGKVVLRARASRWRQITELPDVEVVDDLVAVIAPTTRTERPGLLDRCQALTDAVTIRSFRDAASAAQVMFCCPHLDLSAGKWVAQLLHACQYTGVTDVTAVTCEPLTWRALLDDQRTVLVCDAGHTEVPAGTVTVAAVTGRNSRPRSSR